MKVKCQEEATTWYYCPISAIDCFSRDESIHKKVVQGKCKSCVLGKFVMMDSSLRMLLTKSKKPTVSGLIRTDAKGVSKVFF